MYMPCIRIFPLSQQASDVEGTGLVGYEKARVCIPGMYITAEL